MTDIPHYVKFNRSRLGKLQLGSKAPSCSVVEVCAEGSYVIHSVVSGCLTTPSRVSWMAARLRWACSSSAAHIANDRSFSLVDHSRDPRFASSCKTSST
eukprot:COSAG01_NODE_6021_length_3898_cov_35.243485_4_plen_99_part_00